MAKTLAAVCAALAARPPRVNKRFNGPRAAVLILLTEDEPGGPVYVWLTVRSEELRMNPGEVAFPGGKRDPTDPSDWDTAVREAQEEIGLVPGLVAYVAQLDGIMSRFGLLVVPFVATVPADFVPRPSPREVQEVFRVPLDVFLATDPALHTTAIFETDDGSAQLSHLFYYEGRTIWGLTASMLLHLIEASGYAPIPFDVSLPGSLSWFDRALQHRGGAEGDGDAATASPPRSRL